MIMQRHLTFELRNNLVGDVVLLPTTSDLGRAIGSVCVSCQELLNQMTFDLDIWHGDSPWPLYVKFPGQGYSQSLQSGDDNVLFSTMDAVD